METIGRAEAQAERVGKIKTVIKGLGKNLLYYLCLMAPVAVVGSVWFDITPMLAWRSLYGGIPLLVAFIVAERAMMDIGQEAGKLDNELLEARGDFRTLRRDVIAAGTRQMGDFIIEEIALELDNTRRVACRKLQLDYKVYKEKYARQSKAELRRTFNSRILGAKVYAISLIKPIVLTEDMILNDSSLHKGRGGIGETGEEYVDRKRGIKNTIWSVLTVFIFAGISIGSIRQFSWAVVVYTLWALFLLCYRMARGYKDGVMAYANIQVQNYRDRIGYMERYLEWMKVKNKDTAGGPVGNPDEE